MFFEIRKGISKEIDYLEASCRPLVRVENFGLGIIRRPKLCCNHECNSAQDGQIMLSNASLCSCCYSDNIMKTIKQLWSEKIQYEYIRYGH